MVHIETTVVGRPAEKQQSIGLASRLLNCLGIQQVLSLGCLNDMVKIVA